MALRRLHTAIPEALVPLKLRRTLGRMWCAVSERLAVMGRLTASARVDPALVRALHATAPVGVPRYPHPTGSGREALRDAEAFLAGTALLGDGVSVKLDALSWVRDPFPERGSIARLYFHALRPVESLLHAYAGTANRSYLDCALHLAARWTSECLYRRHPARIWDDHGSALRALTLARLWCVCRAEDPGSPFDRTLVEAIVRHARILSDPAFYRPSHNHGVVQGYALLALGIVFSAHPEALHWRDLGRERLEIQMRENVSPDGLHREHSPQYHFFVLRHFQHAWSFARAQDLEFSSEFEARLDAMRAVGTDLVKPSGLLSALGDTSRTSKILTADLDLDAWPARPAGVGAVPTAPRPASRLDHEAGYAILRGATPAEAATEERYLIFRTATFPTAHIHRDVFSFELYAYGDDLVVDSGGPYAYGDPIRLKLMLTAAHNTVIVDDRNQEVGGSEILRWSTSTECDILDAQHRNYPGVVHRRMIIFMRPGYYILLDRLDADDPRRYTQLFHLSPRLEVSLDGLAVSTVNPSGGPTVRLVPLIQHGVGLRLERGVPQSWHRGWVCVGDQQLVPNWVIGYQRAGASASFAVLLVPEPRGQARRVEASMEGNLFQDEVRITVLTDGQRDEILLPPAGRISVTRSRG